ncbi:MAG: hypothetical protein G8D28_05870 [gamma proteobacterium symbiont of Phacoides pectinatus]
MDRKLTLGLLSLILVALAIAILIPGGGTPDPDPKLPWDIRVDAEGHPSVLGLTLGRSTLREAQALLREEGEVSLFVSPDPHYSVEVYFERLYLSGIRAALVLKLDVGQESMEAMFRRGARIERMDSGSRKVTLRSADIDQLAGTTFRHMTYIPSANLEPDMIRGRFGEPDRLITEAGGEEGVITHWIYFAKGLDIAHNTQGREVFQYVIPTQMEQLIAPLEAAAAE